MYDGQSQVENQNNQASYERKGEEEGNTMTLNAHFIVGTE